MARKPRRSLAQRQVLALEAIARALEDLVVLQQASEAETEVQELRQQMEMWTALTALRVPMGKA